MNLFVLREYIIKRKFERKIRPPARVYMTYRNTDLMECIRSLLVSIYILQVK